MDFLSQLFAQKWVRPLMFVLTGLATITTQVAAPHTIAYGFADQLLKFSFPLAAASIGTQKPTTPPTT
jgi:hypothetical protein